MIAAGIGARRGVTAREVLAAVDAAAAQFGLVRSAITVLASNAAKTVEKGIIEAADILGAECRTISGRSLRIAGGETITHSGASIAATGLASLSEAAALAAAGPHARLLGARIALGPVTCALAKSEDGR